MSKDGTEAMATLLESDGAKVAKKAVALAKHAGRKTVQAEDILQLPVSMYLNYPASQVRIRIFIQPFLMPVQTRSRFSSERCVKRAGRRSID